MVEPPLFAGAVNATLAWVSPAVAVPIIGALGTTAFTVNVWLTVEAAMKPEPPTWSALIVQLPAVTKVNAPPEVIVQTPVVAEVNATARFDVAVAVKVGVVPKFCVPGLAKDIVWLAFGVTEFEAADAWPVPAPLVAVTVNV